MVKQISDNFKKNVSDRGIKMITTGRVDYQKEIDKIKSLIKSQVEIKFGKVSVIPQNIFMIKTIIILKEKEFKMDLCVGRTMSFFIDTIECLEFKNKLYEIYLNSSDIEKTEEAVDKKYARGLNLFVCTLVDLSLERFKQSKEYKLNSLYDNDYEKNFNNKPSF
jgi:hypothetical protein